MKPPRVCQGGLPSSIVREKEWERLTEIVFIKSAVIGTGSGGKTRLRKMVPKQRHRRLAPVNERYRRESDVRPILMGILRPINGNKTPPSRRNHKREYTEAYVYALCDPESQAIRYIGVTVNPEQRLQGHLAGASNRHVVGWISELNQRTLKSFSGVRPDWPSGRHLVTKIVSPRA